MAKKFLDFEGLKAVWGKVKSEDAKVKSALTTEINKKANSNDVYNKSHIDTELGKKLDASKVGANGGVASLGSDGKVPSSQLPSYVDDVLEFDTKTAFPQSGESGKIYISKNDNKTYRWSGTAYVEISSSLALGETASTAYPGNKGAENARMIAAHTKSIEQAIATAERGVSDAHNAQTTANAGKKLAEENKSKLDVLTPKVTKVEQDVSQAISKVDTVKSELNTELGKKVNAIAGKNVIENTASKINIEAKSSDTTKRFGGFVELTDTSAKFGLYNSDTGGQTFHNDCYIHFKKENYNYSVEFVKGNISKGELIGQKDLENYTYNKSTIDNNINTKVSDAVDPNNLVNKFDTTVGDVAVSVSDGELLELNITCISKAELDQILI